MTLCCNENRFTWRYLIRFLFTTVLSHVNMVEIMIDLVQRKQTKTFQINRTDIMAQMDLKLFLWILPHTSDVKQRTLLLFSSYSTVCSHYSVYLSDTLKHSNSLLKSTSFIREEVELPQHAWCIWSFKSSRERIFSITQSFRYGRLSIF